MKVEQVATWEFVKCHPMVRGCGRRLEVMQASLVVGGCGRALLVPDFDCKSMNLVHHLESPPTCEMQMQSE